MEFVPVPQADTSTVLNNANPVSLDAQSAVHPPLVNPATSHSFFKAIPVSQDVDLGTSRTVSFVLHAQLAVLCAQALTSVSSALPDREVTTDSVTRTVPLDQFPATPAPASTAIVLAKLVLNTPPSVPHANLVVEISSVSSALTLAPLEHTPLTELVNIVPTTVNLALDLTPPVPVAQLAKSSTMEPVSTLAPTS